MPENPPFASLVISEDPALNKLVTALVQAVIKTGETFSAASDKEGLAKMKRKKFDLVVLDIPAEAKSQGTAFVQESHRLPSGVRPEFFVFMTARKGQYSANVGKTSFLQKPFTQQQFLELLMKMIPGLIAVNKVPAASEKPASPVSPATPVVKINAEFFTPFMEATLAVFKEIASITPVKEKIFVRDPDAPGGDISAIAEFREEKYVGSMAISFEEKCFLSVAASMLKKPQASITPENENAAMEICSQILVAAAVILSSKGHSIQPAATNVLKGKGHKVKHGVNGTCLAVSFTTEAGRFSVEAVIAGPPARSTTAS